ncbi:MAG: TetR/AcrR family transcriptional regulator [bacterium]|nr:TetR/AcrR family transcriptional regulator [bacterium]
MDTGPKKPYSNHLRKTQVELTQRTIMLAMASVLIEHGPDGDAVKLVAKSASVAERTIYRHFPSKEVLWDSFLLWASVEVGLEKYPATAEEMVDAVPAMFAMFDEHEELMCACLDVRAWSDVWLTGRTGWKDGINLLLTASFSGMGPEARDNAGAAIHLLFNGLSWKTLKDQWGFSGTEAAVATQKALTVLFEEFRRAAAEEALQDTGKGTTKPRLERRKVEGHEVQGRHYCREKRWRSVECAPNALKP